MMTRSLLFVLVATAVVSATAFRSAVSADRGRTTQLRAGAAAVDITPKELPLNMPGGFSANMAESVHDPFYWERRRKCSWKPNRSRRVASTSPRTEC